MAFQNPDLQDAIKSLSKDRSEDPRTGITKAQLWGNTLGSALSAVVAQMTGNSPLAAGAAAFSGGAESAIDFNAKELAAEYKLQQLDNERTRMAAALTSPTQTTRVEGEETVTERFTPAGGRREVSRGPRFSPAQRGVGGATFLKSLNTQSTMLDRNIDAVYKKYKGAAKNSLPKPPGYEAMSGFDKWTWQQSASADILAFLREEAKVNPAAKKDLADLEANFTALQEVTNRATGRKPAPSATDFQQIISENPGDF